MALSDFDYGICPGELIVYEWELPPDWIRFADGKKRLVKPGEHFLVHHREGDEDDQGQFIMIIEKIELH